MKHDERRQNTDRSGFSLACDLCTGSPEYRPPEDISTLPQVSEQVLARPGEDLAELEDVLRRQIETCNLKEENNHE